MAIGELAPQSLGELLDRTFSYYRAHFWLFAGITALPEVVMVALSLLLNAFVRPQLTNPQDAAVIRSQMPHLVFGYMGWSLLIVVISLVCYTVSLGATTFAVSDVCLGRSAGIGNAYHRLWRKFSKLVGLTLLLGFIATGAYVLATLVATTITVALLNLLHVRGNAAAAVGVLAIIMVLGLIIVVSLLLLRLVLAVPALMLEEIGPGGALKRSFRLTNRAVGRLLLIVILGLIIYAVAGFAFQAPFWAAGAVMGFKLTMMPLWLMAPATVAGGFGAAAGGPVLIIALVLFYYDARVRREGFDLQLMMTSLDETVPPSPSFPGFTPAS
jgi:hypothetical protein